MATNKVKNKTKIKLEIIFLELILIGAAIAIFFVSKVENYTFDRSAIYFSIGDDCEIPAGSKAQVDSDLDSVVIKLDKENKLQADGEPVYYSSNEFVSIDDYIYYDIHANSIEGYKISHFTEFEKVDGGVLAKRSESTKAIEGGFLFDGSDTYIFMEDMTMQFNGNSVNVPAMSYVRVCKGNWIVFNDRNAGYVTFEYLDSQYEVTIRDKKNTYIISAETDLVSLGQKDEKVMLFSNPDLYTLFDFGG